jgi:hypothetical protein
MAVKVLDHEFPQNTPDEVWLAEAGRQGWVVLTKDQGIRYSELERTEILAAGVRCFVLVSHAITGPDMAAILVSALPRMVEFCETTAAPFIAKIYRDGRVSRWI